jgi:predicted lipoprotein with Yx(FWY)xxD motif
MRIKVMLTTALAVAAATVFVAAAPFASGATSKATTASGSVKISTRTVAGLGKVLVSSTGRTLYMFVPDKHKKVTCVSTCAKIWPPIFGSKATASGGAKQSLIGSDKDPAGGRVITYNHWPLYLYLGDPKAGSVHGQALNMNGGLWYALSPAGAVIKKKVSKGGGGGGTTTTTTTTSSTTTAGGGTTTTGTSTSTGTGACPGGDDADNDGDQNAGGPDDGDGCI